MFTLNPSCGSSRTHLSPSPTSTRLRTRTKRFGGALLLDAGGLEQEHERRGAAVHDRHLGGREIDERVVDAEPGHRRQQVLDGADLRVVVLERRAEHRLA